MLSLLISLVASERPFWTGPGGLPTAHAVRAAIHVASLLDRRGSRVVDARESYWHRATGGLFAPPDLELGERLLVDCGLVDERGGKLYPLPELEQLLDGVFDDAVSVICARAAAAAPAPPAPEEFEGRLAELLPDAERREELLLALGRRFDDARQRLLGAIGEEVVVAALRRELESLGYPELARTVRHVSLESDQAGYDISAPRVAGTRRLLEVKATTNVGDAILFHLSRNEAEVGLRFREWSLVICHVTDVGRRAAQIVGWCTAQHLEPSFPADSTGGRWEAAAMTVTIADLIPGLPSAVA